LKATFCDFNSSSYCVYYPYYSNAATLHLFVNTTFKNLNTSYSYCPTINIGYAESPVSIINCTFNNLCTTSTGVNAAAFYMNMGSSYAYIFSGNTISNVIGAKSAVYTTGNFSTFTFENNLFENIESTGSYGGVYFIYTYFLFYLFFYFFFFLFYYIFV
jgi:hypothetical protein